MSINTKDTGAEGHTNPTSIPVGILSKDEIWNLIADRIYFELQDVQSPLMSKIWEKAGDRVFIELQSIREAVVQLNKDIVDIREQIDDYTSIIDQVQQSLKALETHSHIIGTPIS